MFSFGMFRLDGSFRRVRFVGAVDRWSRGWRSPSGQNRQGLRLANQHSPRPPNIHLPRGAHRNPKSFEKNNLTRDLPERFLTSRVKQVLTYGLPWRKSDLSIGAFLFFPGPFKIYVQLRSPKHSDHTKNMRNDA